MNKVLLQSEPALEASINYISVWVSDKKYFDSFKNYEVILVRILKKYEVDMLEESDEAFVEENLIRIAWTLMQWGNLNPIVTLWIEKGKNSKFNNVLQYIAQVSKYANDPDDE